ncbi:hypothetical protein HIM_08232 [Hirsutella minnesotensis 3608]|uniref:Uncharacterized protein n=1 Tax=Hirsutella minnesotensis 3608 TaxID=1043627 RepID=A0A0F8A3U3_9HYPO|nr:hypothetical protein HIM_08232 [Hirsutella minnesotensis 3608]
MTADLRGYGGEPELSDRLVPIDPVRQIPWQTRQWQQRRRQGLSFVSLSNTKRSPVCLHKHRDLPRPVTRSRAKGGWGRQYRRSGCPSQQARARHGVGPRFIYDLKHGRPNGETTWRSFCRHRPSRLQTFRDSAGFWSCITMLLLAIFAVFLTAGAASHDRFDNLVAFGDSYTDEGRGDYFNRNHRAPPEGQRLPPRNVTFSGGYAWPRFVTARTGASTYNYAVAGAVCSNDIVTRILDPINAPFPSVLEYEAPVFGRESSNRSLYPNRRADNTVYALWIGTNDLGIDGFLGATQHKDKTLTSFVDCVWALFDSVYRAGGRRFILINQLPLQLAPLYATPGAAGRGNTRYWRDRAAYNVTDFQDKLKQYTTTVNTMFDYGVPFELLVRQRWRGSTFSILDAHSILTDVYADPSRYLDSPANLTAPYRNCLRGCVDSSEPLSGFMW